MSSCADARSQRRAEAARNKRAEAAAAAGRPIGVPGRPGKRARGAGPHELSQLTDEESAIISMMRRTSEDEEYAAQYLERMLRALSTSDA